MWVRLRRLTLRETVAKRKSGQQGQRYSSNGSVRGAIKANVAVLAPDQSAALRDRLLGEVAHITEPDKAAVWARAGLAAKNSLQPVDARLLEDAFEHQLSGLLESVVADEPT
jgi:hypothetical protein